MLTGDAPDPICIDITALQSRGAGSVADDWLMTTTERNDGVTKRCGGVLQLQHLEGINERTTLDVQSMTALSADRYRRAIAHKDTIRQSRRGTSEVQCAKHARAVTEELAAIDIDGGTSKAADCHLIIFEGAIDEGCPGLY